MELSMLQRSVMMLMFLIENEHQAQIGYDRPRRQAWFPRRSLEMMLSFDWRQFHSLKMRELVKEGMIMEERDMHGIVRYALSARGIKELQPSARIASAYVTYVRVSDFRQPGLFDGMKHE
jgi:hypothetical protein